jgi:hypothetical protein
MSAGIVYHLPIPGHSCKRLWVRGVARHTCPDFWFKPIGHAPKAGAR